MRFQEMYYIAKHALDRWLDLDIKELALSDKSKKYEVKNVRAVNELLDELGPIEFVRADVESFRQSNPGLRPGSLETVLSPAEYPTVKRCLSDIKSKLDLIVRLAESVGYDVSHDGFDVKLPPNLSLKQTAECIADLDSIFSQCPILNQEGERIVFQGADRGSIWLLFAVVGGGTVTLAALAKLVDIALQLRSHALTLKEQEERGKQLGMQTEELKAMVKANKKLLQLETEQAAKALAQEYNVEDPEAVERTRYSLSRLKELMDQGLEIYKAIGSGPNIKAVFPPVEAQHLPEQTIQRLTEHEEDTNE